MNEKNITPFNDLKTRTQRLGNKVMTALNTLDEKLYEKNTNPLSGPTAPGAEGKWEHGYMGISPDEFDQSIEDLLERVKRTR